MATLTAEDTFSVNAAADEVAESVDVTVVSAVGYPGGKGRLYPPVYGTYDYDIAPDEWDNLDLDVLYPPIWSHTQTLTSVVSTRWAGTIKDVVVRERWINRVVFKSAQFRMFIDMWMNPPSAGNIVWSPTYVTNTQFNVEMVSIDAGGSNGLTQDYLLLQGGGFIKGPFTIEYKVISKVED